MDLKPGDVVVLKSGGHSLCVAEVGEDTATCVWMGNEGDLFRETLPLAVLELEVDPSDDDGEEDDQADDHDKESEDDEETDRDGKVA